MWQKFKKWSSELASVYITNSVISVALIIAGVLYLVTNVPSFQDPVMMQIHAESTTLAIGQAIIIAGVLQLVIPLFTFTVTYGQQQKKQKESADLHNMVALIAEQNKVLLDKLNQSPPPTTDTDEPNTIDTVIAELTT